MAAFFAGGAIGSSLGGWIYAIGGWDLASSVGCGFAVLAFGLPIAVPERTAARRPVFP
jgi:hypothetical protein